MRRYRFRYRPAGAPQERTWEVFYEGSHLGTVRQRRVGGRWEWWRRLKCGRWATRAEGGFPSYRYGEAESLFTGKEGLF